MIKADDRGKVLSYIFAYGLPLSIRFQSSRKLTETSRAFNFSAHQYLRGGANRQRKAKGQTQRNERGREKPKPARGLKKAEVGGPAMDPYCRLPQHSHSRMATQHGPAPHSQRERDRGFPGEADLDRSTRKIPTPLQNNTSRAFHVCLPESSGQW